MNIKCFPKIINKSIDKKHQVSLDVQLLSSKL